MSSVPEHVANNEEAIMNLIVLSGQSRSLAFEALNEAKVNNFDQAEELMRQSAQVSIEAHEAQTELLRREIAGQPVTVSLLMVHAQDHLMDSILARDLVAEIIALRREIKEA